MHRLVSIAGVALLASCSAAPEPQTEVPERGGAACLIELAPGTDPAAIFEFNRVRQGVACELNGRSSIIYTGEGNCDAPRAFGSARPLSMEEARRSAEACAAGSQRRPGKYTTVVRLKAGSRSEAQVAEFGRRLYEVALRAPLRLTYSSGFNDIYCFEYDETADFHGAFTAATSAFGSTLTTEDLTGSHCEQRLAMATAG